MSRDKKTGKIHSGSNRRSAQPDRRNCLMIPEVCERLNVTGKFLRLLERNSIVVPFTDDANHAYRILYRPADVDRLKYILTLTREYGVNLAGVTFIMEMQRRTRKMCSLMREFTNWTLKTYNSEEAVDRLSSTNHKQP